MEEQRVGVVILNYISVNETLECVDSFLKQDYNNMEIIIVENGSPNKSAQILQEIYKEVSRVHVLTSDQNLGFAKGNNIGIRYARNKLKCDCVIVTNSDTLVDKTLITDLLEGNEVGVGVISPTVIHVDGKLQQPSVNTDSLKKYIFMTYFRIFITILKNYIGKRNPQIVQGEASQENIVKDDIQYIPRRYYLQGCSYMLTEQFFEHYTQLYPETFLYWEEIDLLWYLEQAHLKAVYKETTPVLHKVARSSTSLLRDSEQINKKMKYVLDGMRKSTPLFFMNYKKIWKKYNS